MVSSITSAGSTAAAKPATQNLGQADFIRLMTTQMKMQDPTDPQVGVRTFKLVILRANQFKRWVRIATDKHARTGNLLSGP